MITLAGENAVNGVPSQQDLAAWADTFGLNHPVLSDPDYAVTARFVDGGTIGLPSMTLLIPGVEVLKRDATITENHIKLNLP